MSPSVQSWSLPIERESDSDERFRVRSSSTSLVERSASAAISSTVGSRSSFRERASRTRETRLASEACLWGRRTAPVCSARAWEMACLTHQTA